MSGFTSSLDPCQLAWQVNEIGSYQQRHPPVLFEACVAANLALPPGKLAGDGCIDTVKVVSGER